MNQIMTFAGNRGFAIVAGLAFAVGVLQWRTLLFAVPDISSQPRRMTNITTKPARACSQSPQPKDICSLLPTDNTASFVWNSQEFADIRKRWTGNSKMNDSITSTLLHFLNAYRLLRGVRRVPSHNSWKRVLEQDRPLQVWLFVNPLDVPQPSDCIDELSSSCAPTWIQLLQDMAATAAQSCMLDIEYTVFDWSFATTEFYTRLLTAQREKTTPGPDVIVHALSRHDLRHAGMEHRDPHSVLWEEERRRILQDFVRAGRRANPCHDTVMIFVDDYYYLSSTQSTASMWVEQVNSRMLQQVADHYGAGLLSYSQVVMEWMMQNRQTTDNHSRMAPNDAGQFKDTAHKVLAQTILYGLLHFTVTYCNTRDQTTTTSDAVPVESLVPPDIANRVKTVLPPVLDAEQTFLTVSEEWQLQDEMEQQFQERFCTNATESPTICLANFYVGQPLSTLGNGESPDGWILSSEGILRFRNSAPLKWSSLGGEAKSRLQGGRITLFMRLPDAENLQLNWTVTSQDSFTTGNFLSAEDDTSSKNNVAVQMVAQLPDRIGDDLSFHGLFPLPGGIDPTSHQQLARDYLAMDARSYDDLIE